MFQNPLIVRAYLHGLMMLHLLPHDPDGARLYAVLAVVDLFDWWLMRQV